MTRHDFPRKQAGGPGSARLMISLTTFAVRHRRWVIGVWLLMLIAGGAAAGQVSHRLSSDFSLPGQPGYETAQKMPHSYGNDDQPPSVLTVTVPAGESVRVDAAQIAAAFGRLRAADRQLRIVDYGDTRDPAFITSTGRITYALVFAPQPRSFSSALASQRALPIVQSALPPGPCRGPGRDRVLRSRRQVLGVGAQHVRQRGPMVLSPIRDCCLAVVGTELAIAGDGRLRSFRPGRSCLSGYARRRPSAPAWPGHPPGGQPRIQKRSCVMLSD